MRGTLRRYTDPPQSPRSAPALICSGLTKNVVMCTLQYVVGLAWFCGGNGPATAGLVTWGAYGARVAWEAENWLDLLGLCEA